MTATSLPRLTEYLTPLSALWVTGVLSCTLPGCPTNLPLQEGLSAVLLAFFCLTCLLLLVPLLLLFTCSIRPRCSGWLAPEDRWLCPLEPNKTRQLFSSHLLLDGLSSLSLSLSLSCVSVPSNAPTDRLTDFLASS